MSDLTDAEHEHLVRFGQARKDWRLYALEDRMYDEAQDGDSREHKYPRSHPYITGLQYVLRYVRDSGATEVIDIGSPIAQNVALACMPNVRVTVVDVRPHTDAELLGLDWRIGTATALPFDSGSVSLLTSLWVMGHVGDGRYGDALDIDGDRRMIAEIARALRPGGTAIIGPGLVAEQAGYIFNLHRIYTWAWLREEFGRAGLEVVEEHNLFVANEVFLTAQNIGRRDGHYALALLRKR